jgi:hypothetical protein
MRILPSSADGNGYWLATQVLTTAGHGGDLRPEATARLSRYCPSSDGGVGSAASAAPGCVVDDAGWTQVAARLLELGPWSWSRISFKARCR